MKKSSDYLGTTPLNRRDVGDYVGFSMDFRNIKFPYWIEDLLNNNNGKYIITHEGRFLFDKINPESMLLLKSIFSSDDTMLNTHLALTCRIKGTDTNSLYIDFKHGDILIYSESKRFLCFYDKRAAKGFFDIIGKPQQLGDQYFYLELKEKNANASLPFARTAGLNRYVVPDDHKIGVMNRVIEPVNVEVKTTSDVLAQKHGFNQINKDKEFKMKEQVSNKKKFVSEMSINTIKLCESGVHSFEPRYNINEKLIDEDYDITKTYIGDVCSRCGKRVNFDDSKIQQEYKLLEQFIKHEDAHQEIQRELRGKLNAQTPVQPPPFFNPPAFNNNNGFHGQDRFAPPPISPFNSLSQFPRRLTVISPKEIPFCGFHYNGDRQNNINNLIKYLNNHFVVPVKYSNTTCNGDITNLPECCVLREFSYDANLDLITAMVYPNGEYMNKFIEEINSPNRTKRFYVIPVNVAYTFKSIPVGIVWK